MARNNSSPVQQFRGTTAQHATYTGLPGELTVDTDKHVVVVHDGSTAGGVPMARADHKHPEYSIGTASGTVSGTTKLSDATNSTSDVNSGVAATPKAVKAAYDKAVEAQNIGILLGIDWIGVPRYWRSTNLPANHCWANGDFVSFADWPELKEVYDAGGFQGMLMAWDADEETQAANLGMWRPDAAKPTGLFTPNLSGQFFRNWAQGSSKQSGAYEHDTGRNLEGAFRPSAHGTGYENLSDGVFFDKISNASLAAQGSQGPVKIIGFSAEKNWGIHVGQEFAPVHVWQPVILYLGRAAQV